MEEAKSDLTKQLLQPSEKYEPLSFDEDKNSHSSSSSHTSSSFDPEIYKIPDIDVQKGAVRRLITVSVVCLLLMLGKLIGGLIANSLTILTDAAHMFSDLSGFQISLISLYIAKRPADTSMSYGYHRAEVIGAMASVILIWGLTVWLVTEATERIIKMDYEINGLVMLITAVGGLITNLLMFKILHSEGHGHSHGGHGHAHSNGCKSKNHKPVKIQDMDFAEDEGLDDVEKEKGELEVMIKNMKKQKKEAHGHAHAHNCKKEGHGHAHNDNKKSKEKIIEMQNEPTMSGDNEQQFKDESPNQVNEHQHPECELKKNKKADQENQEEEEAQRSESNLSIIEESDNPNLRAAWIHMLGDTISSFGAVVASIIIYFWSWMKIVDPICTYFFAILVFLTTVPISKDCILVLMEGTPVGISVDDFEKELKEIKGVVSVHDIHIWQLSAGKPSMSCHLIAKDTNLALKKATILCRKKGIYHSTIQIEDVKMINEVDAIKCEQNIH